jgi:hypothetical protein
VIAALAIVVLAAGDATSSTHATLPLTRPAHNAADAQPAQKTKELVSANKVDDRLARYTLWLTVFTGVLVVGAAYQGNQLRRTVAQMVQSEERQLRAYVFIAKITPMNPTAHTPPEPCGYSVTIRNSGQTPAYDVVCNLELRAIDDTAPRFPLNALPDDHTRFPIPGGGGISKMSFPPMSLSPTKLARLTIGSDRIYLWGEITYRDIFGKKRLTKVRFVRKPDSHSFVGCNQSNEAY